MPAHIPAKQRVLLACPRDHSVVPYARGEKPFVYRPSGEVTPPALAEGEFLATYRYPHHDYWRT
jgi:hypothetical protein